MEKGTLSELTVAMPLNKQRNNIIISQCSSLEHNLKKL